MNLPSSTRPSGPGRARPAPARAPVLALLAGLSLAACTAPESEQSPLDLTLFARFDTFLEENSQIDWVARHEDAIADCMKAQGFDYVPDLPVVTVADLDGAPQQGTPEYAAEYGYGVTDSPGRTEEITEGERLLEEQGDPQQDLVDALSAAQKAAYDSALWGADPATGTEDVRKSVATEDRGCRAIAEDEVGPDPASFLFTPELEALQASMAQIDVRVADDPRLAATHEQWADCMSDAGIVGFSHPDDALQSIVTELTTDFPTLESATLENPAYAALQQRELATATADLACRTEIDYDAQQQTVRHDLEADFLTENRELVEQAVAQFEKVSGWDAP
ncbi:hypothetical protein [Oerskovia paurometabola]|uniref:Uncharacterized protein n=1 Tax=Oerskovia paurometabola TaxID=162170 RepID=A0ABW1XCE6_9CELL|nr:hypothetical protein [Oerskovia paurometabola]MBM7496616.1 hypothetical protein [Oerskovia paurometabola]